MNIVKEIEALMRHVEAHNFAGFDPYDALNSPIVRTLSFNQKYLRIAWIQLFRRLPVNLRHIMFLKPGHNPKGLGLFLEGYTKLYRLENRPEFFSNAILLRDLLELHKTKGFSGNSWGYNFDWQSRAFFVPKHTPTIVNSSFVGHALLDAYEAFGGQAFLDMAVPIKDFLLTDLGRTKVGDTFCFTYTPGDTTAVHNANMLGASLLIRLFKFTGEEALRDAAHSSLAYSMRYQMTDGSWFYAEAEKQRWIDSFHTGFNLESLRWFQMCGEAGEYDEAYQRGVNYYAKTFFLKDGTPKYYHDQTFPIDIHAPAEAVAFFSGEGDQYADLTDRILKWMLLNMRDPSGYFYFRKGRYWTNKISYMRWTQAWVFRALTEYHSNRVMGR